MMCICICIYIYILCLYQFSTISVSGVVVVLDLIAGFLGALGRLFGRRDGQVKAQGPPSKQINNLMHHHQHNPDPN